MNKEIEDEQLYSRNEDGVITEPFNPKDVDIISQPMVIFNIVENLRDEDIILDPDFQRIPDLWDAQKQSRLFEYMIIRIPLRDKRGNLSDYPSGLLDEWGILMTELI